MNNIKKLQQRIKEVNQVNGSPKRGLENFRGKEVRDESSQ